MLPIFRYNPEDYPHFQMVRCVMYITIGTVFVWNGRMTLNVMKMNPDLIIATSAMSRVTTYCDLTVYNFSYVLVIFFNVLFLTSLVIWLASIVSGTKFMIPKSFVK